MLTLNEIKQRIKEIAESTEGIGKVYDRFVYAFDSKQLKDLFVSDGKINALMFRHTQRESERGEGGKNELFARRLWKFRLIFGYNCDEESENQFDDICEALCEKFNSDSLSKCGIWRSSFMNITDKYDSEYHGVLVHNARMEMETT